ncbi:Putative flippase GtrA (transmembrane translocase of bactoprenol-linked glucose) [Pseudidiomarina planktonica]|uniref:Putative flippase GtrA (Transmembrane translocase of bactoprenol-linked glucose) n=1 Tax=Pseudidiomarina planktonica TaxID=1323738 RepID=A0A1Y6ENR9_9GAMM|nr:GtrA family protein [Pseudidiomarina planktonica]SMQ61823.1 Putative flippase GtrA (transmembrane translocase of bactoprenol-linked glucose) [Pseudidiomarina planktonica]
MKISDFEFFRFLVVGVINTAVGYGVFYLLLRYLHVQPYLANAIGYCVALSVAFTLSRCFVFNKTYKPRMVLNFTIAFILAFGLNQITLFLSLNVAGLIPELAQLFAMAVYTVAFFFLNKYFVFNR